MVVETGVFLEPDHVEIGTSVLIVCPATRADRHLGAHCVPGNFEHNSSRLPRRVLDNLTLDTTADYLKLFDECAC